LRLERAELRRVRFHDLRHCFGTVAVRAFPLSDVQAMFGHAHVTTTMRYVHHRPGADDAAKLSAAFAGEAVPRAVPRDGRFEHNSAQLSDRKALCRAKRHPYLSAAKPFTPVRFRSSPYLQ